MAAEAVQVFDACALIALLHEEPGAEEAFSILESGDRCLIHAVNLCEVYYDLLRRDSGASAEALQIILRGIGLEVHEAVSPALWQAAGHLKAERRRVSLADCFAMALTIHEGGSLLTTDHHEFDAIAAAGICPIRFLR